MIRCPVWGCGSRIPNRDLTCRSHWRLVPASLKASFLSARRVADWPAVRVCRRHVGDVVADEVFGAGRVEGAARPAPEGAGLTLRQVAALVRGEGVDG